MHIKTEQESLFAAVRRAAAVSGKLPPLASLRVWANAEGLFVESTDGTQRWSERVEAEVDGDINVGFATDQIQTAIGALPKGEISIEFEETCPAVLKSGRRKFRLYHFHGDEMPETSVSRQPAKIMLPSTELARLIDSVKHATDIEDRASNGIHIESDGRVIRATAFDGKQFAVASAAVIAPEASMQPPSAAVAPLRSMCELAEDIGLDRLDAGKVRIVAGNVAMLISEHAQSRMPDVMKNVVSGATAPIFSIKDNGALLDSIKSIVTAAKREARQVNLELNCEDLLISAADPTRGAEANDAVPVERLRDGDFSMRINADYLANAIKASGDCEVFMIMAGGDSNAIGFRRGEDLVCGAAKIMG